MSGPVTLRAVAMSRADYYRLRRDRLQQRLASLPEGGRAKSFRGLVALYDDLAATAERHLTEEV